MTDGLNRTQFELSNDIAMSTGIKIIQTEDFMRVQPDGRLDLTASLLGLLRDIVSKLHSTGEYHVLVDTRRADVQLSPADIFQIGDAVASDPSLGNRKVGLVVARGDEADAGFFELVSRNRGADVRAFSSFEPAITWLIMQDRS